MAVIFGSPGLTAIDDVLELVEDKLKTTKKPIYLILPSTVNTKRELEAFRSKGHIFFTDESIFGSALTKIKATPKPYSDKNDIVVDKVAIREVIDRNSDGYLSAQDVNKLLVAAGIPVVKEIVTSDIEEAVAKADDMGYPVVMKVVGPVHKSDVGGVVLNVKDSQTVRSEFVRMM